MSGQNMRIYLVILIVIALSNGYAVWDSVFQPDIPYFSEVHLFFALIVLFFGAILAYVYFHFKKKLHHLARVNEHLKLDQQKFQNGLKVDASRLPDMEMLSHEVRSAMSGIITFSELLNEPGLTREQQKVSANMIHTSGERMLYIVNELLDLLRIESGTETVHDSLVNINDLMDSIYQRLRFDAVRKNIQFNLSKFLTDNQSVLKTDRVKVEAILSHLVRNAIKYTDKGSVDLGYEIVALNEGVYSDFVLRFFVRDTGIGILPEVKKDIFKRYVPSDTERMVPRSGIGLGLSIAKAYAEMLGGTLRVESEENRGSTFWFQLPYDGKFQPDTEEVKELPAQKVKKSSTVKNLKILIVEDDEISEKYLVEILNKKENQLYFAHSGTVAVEMCRNMPDIDLILMDIKMPMMDGNEATRRIREFNQEVVIFAQTAYVQPRDKSKALKSGCNEFITKPVNKKKLHELINIHVKKKKNS
ncbi:MAG: response regulator [Bacteroidales bacterium]|nr:response regulator [Bacteroidales bacterium]